MKTREQRRAELVPGLARITRSRDFRTSLGRASSEGNSLTIIPVLPDDTMGYVFDRLRDSGGRAVVAQQVDDGWDFAVMWPASPERVAVAREDDHVAQIHGNSPVEIFFSYLEKVRTAVIREVAAQLVEHGERDRELAGC